MTTHPWIAAGCIAVALGVAHAGEVEDFEQELLRCETLMERQKWRDAADGLRWLLENHPRQPYVQPYRARVEENVKRCAFRIGVTLPELDDLLSGELREFDRRTGRMRLRYTPDTARDFVRKPDLFFHPVLFDGPYSVKVTGEVYPQVSQTGGQAPMILCGFENDEHVAAGFGLERKLFGNTVRHNTAWLIRYRGEDHDVLAEKDTTPCKSGKPFRLELKVGPTSVTALYNGRSFMSGAKSKDVFGTVAFQNLPAWTEIELAGDAQATWFQQVEDAAAQQALLDWEKEYDPKMWLPEWLLAGDFETPATGDGAVTAEERPYPGEATDQRDRLFDEASRFLEREQWGRALVFVEENETVLGAVLAAFLRACCRDGNGDAAGALVDLERVIAADPAHFGSALMRLRLLLAERQEGAEDDCRAMLEQHPNRPELYVELTSSLFRAGRTDEAHEVVRLALGRGVTSEDLHDYDRYLTLAAKGPDWSRSYEHSSRNYHVLSDIDVQTCRDAAALLERAYAAYSTRLQPVPNLERRKFKVWLFSGQNGYEVHVQRVLGSGVPPYHTLGVYSGLLKQLFIWNQRDRAGMMTTVQHEGFHQYLDRLVADAPSWFNEGLAEYYEVGGVEGTGWKEGQLHPDDLPTLQSGVELVPLATFLYQDAETFYGNAGLHYAQAWGLIHFLRHGTSDDRRRFDKLFAALVAGATGKKAVQRAFAGADMQDLDLRFAAYVRDLR